jgi:hypothetical protein
MKTAEVETDEKLGNKFNKNVNQIAIRTLFLVYLPKIENPKSFATVDIEEIKG